ncbi:hypothetical protein HZH66_000638 [Vespula vulgaris]|uniref:Uncharacterized protein n=1 Tax=Vespula vulgaris TaxID=7454 RepID=A0A834KRU9_VESVU|nr:hypothetical protein HZH66_000638 [Vespula vulgaris]
MKSLIGPVSKITLQTIAVAPSNEKKGYDEVGRNGDKDEDENDDDDGDDDDDDDKNDDDEEEKENAKICQLQRGSIRQVSGAKKSADRDIPDGTKDILITRNVFEIAQGRSKRVKSKKSESKNESKSKSKSNSNSNDAIVVVVAIVVGGSIEDRRRRLDSTSDQNDLFHGTFFRSTDFELARILLLRSRSLRGRITTSSSKREKISSRLVCLERGMSEGERSHRLRLAPRLPYSPAALSAKSSDDSTKPLEFPKINVTQMVENGPPRRASRTSKRDPKMAGNRCR